MKTILSSLALVSSLLSASLVLALETGGISGGSGQGLKDSVANKIELRDFVEGVVCEWVTADSLVAANATFARLQFFTQFFFSNGSAVLDGLERQVMQTRVCLSAEPLRVIPDSAQQEVTVFNSRHFQEYQLDEKATKLVQLAVRVDDEIYLDRNEFKNLSDVKQGYLLLHELTHGFLPMNTPARMRKLKDFVATFRKLEASIPGKTTEITSRFLMGSYTTAPDRILFDSMNDTFDRAVRDNGLKPIPQLPLEKRVAIVLRRVQEGLILPPLTLTGTVFDLFPFNVNLRLNTEYTFFTYLVHLIKNCDAASKKMICINGHAILQSAIDQNANLTEIYPSAELGNHPVWKYLLFSAINHRVYRVKMAKMMIAQIRDSLEDHPADLASFEVELEQVLINASGRAELYAAVAGIAQARINVNARAENGDTAMISAARTSPDAWVPFPTLLNIGFLLKAGADASLANKAGETALSLWLKQDRGGSGNEPNGDPQYIAVKHTLQQSKPSFEYLLAEIRNSKMRPADIDDIVAILTAKNP